MYPVVAFGRYFARLAHNLRGTSPSRSVGKRRPWPIEKNDLYMNAKLFRILVVTEILLSIAVIVSDIVTRHQLPAELQQFHWAGGEDAMNAEMRASDWVLAFGGLSLVALGMVSLIGLLFLWRPARLLYTVTYILAFPLVLMAGPSVSTAITETLGEISNFLGGVIWALLYFSSIKERFETDADAPVL
jgi:hypothetical protein